MRQKRFPKNDRNITICDKWAARYSKSVDRNLVRAFVVQCKSPIYVKTKTVSYRQEEPFLLTNPYSPKESENYAPAYLHRYTGGLTQRLFLFGLIHEVYK